MMIKLRSSTKKRSLTFACLGLVAFKCVLLVVQFYNERTFHSRQTQALNVRFTRGVIPGKISPAVEGSSVRNTDLKLEELSGDVFSSPQRKKLIIYWSGVRGHKVPVQKSGVNHSHFWPFFYAGPTGSCPVPCELSNDVRRASEASAFVVHAREPDIWNLPPIENLAPWILQTNENPVYTPSLSDPSIMTKFNLLIGYRLDSDFPAPIYPMPEMTAPLPFAERLGNVLAVFSKCEPVRTEYMRQLMKHIQVDSYGACLKNKEGLIGLYGKVDNKYVFKDHKVVLSRFYKFSLVFMNQDCDYFVDDRLYHALTSGSVPVFMGTDKIDQFLPGNLKNSIIKVSDFKSPKELADYLTFLSNNETAYMKYLEWKSTGIGQLNDTKIGRWWKPKYPLFCQVCMALAKGKLHHGLKPDFCRPRRYEDWGLEDPTVPTFDYLTFGVFISFGLVLFLLLLS